MSLPLNEFSSPAVPGVFQAPDDRPRTSLLEDWELGGVALGDPSQGLQVQNWQARLSGDDIQVKPETGLVWSTVITVAGVTELAFAFDQNMRPVVAYVAAGVAKMYWFDTVAAAFVTTTFAGASSPVVTMDDKRRSLVSLSDVLLFYIRAGNVYYRQQRDRFTIERLLGAVPVGMTRFLRWGMSTTLRVQLEFGTDALEVPVVDGQSTAYTDLLTDTLYVVEDVDVIPMFEVGARTGRWRSPIVLVHAHPGLAWVRVNGPMSNPVTVRLYGDGVLWCTTTLTARAPVRLPAGRFKHLEVEVEGLGRVGTVALATTTTELIVNMGA